MKQESFFSSVCRLAIPAALQSMLQSSFSIVDQIMIGQLGNVAIAGVGLAGKFSSIFSVVAAAVGAVAGIMISQYLGQGNRRETRRSFWLNFALAAAVAGLFTALCLLRPEAILSLYTTDAETRLAGSAYLSVIAWTFFPLAGATMLSALLRCMEKAKLPLYASVASALLNTGLNYLLIFGKCGLPALGAPGAAIATAVSQWGNFLLMVCMLPKGAGLFGADGAQCPAHARFHTGQYLSMLLPVLVCEGLWSVGENVYAAIYGHMGTVASAAMTLTNPVQGLVIGALCGLSQAAGVIVGKALGRHDFDGAYRSAKRLMLYGLGGALCLSALVVLGSGVYVKIYQVSPGVRLLTRRILYAYAAIAPVKVLNMILGGGVIRSGGKTGYVMAIDLVGTWLFGVPLGYLAAFCWGLSIEWVYYILSLEECVRLLLGLLVFRKRRWMQTLRAEA